MWLNAAAATLYAGCGDNIMYAIDVNDDGGRVQRDFVAHRDYIHSVCGNEASGRLFSAGEDGAVRFWDAREQRSTGAVEPWKQARLARPEFGRWLGAAAVTDGDWLLCGGGPRLALWHLRTLECTTVYGAFGGGVHVAGFVDDLVLAGGESATASVHEYSLNGALVAEVPVSGPAVYSAVWQRDGSGRGLLSLGGASNRLDVCTNWRYRDLVLELYETKKETAAAATM